MKNEVNEIAFLKSCKDPGDYPKRFIPEYAFIGRSNVGKSSLINMLVNRKNIARISNTPGKTQLVNFFLVNDSWYLADLPGYGYAKRSKKERAAWEKMISTYLLSRKNLINIFLLVDARHEPQELDTRFMKNLASNQLPFTIIFTKTDKLKPQELERNLENYLTELSEDWEEIPPYVVSSAITGKGREELLDIIRENNKLFADQQ
ncbi:MAG: ribosome biogenesis GTP-binding protein YihA/YsxC [Bacteroidales bacterium]|nr:ribosome biogenesis GTP-binding protein YihA/YsxC [Bacteroidales bacterium]MCF8339099.1 ribosome biogenesis GTP-binding protein YihA/YsxC [Bacteroidales bacterium]